MNRPPKRNSSADSGPPEPFGAAGAFKRKLEQKPSGKYGKYIRPSRRTNILVFALLLIFGIIWIGWTVSDVTGEYASSGRDREIVRLSMVRRATNVECKLNWGRGAVMEATVNQIDSSKPLHLTFQTPAAWVNRGKQARFVTLDGKFAGNGMDPMKGSFQENEIHAKLFEGNRVVKVRLLRNSITSLYRQVQSHWPWAEN